MKVPEITGKRIKKYLAEGKRFDGRKPEQFRDLDIQTGVSKNAEGSAKVKLGKTEVLVGVKMNVGTPYPDSPDKGNLMVTAELLPLSSSRFELGPPKFPAIELARVLDRAVRESKFIDVEKLVIKSGEAVWTVFIDVYSINDDGNLLDAAGLGIIAALKTAKIPKYDAKEEKVLHGELSSTSLPLSKNMPLSITVHKIGEGLVIDPNREEEDVSETRVTIGISNGVISSMQKGEEKELSVDEFNKVLDISEVAWKDLFKKFEKLIK
jgi:exosome complex component RRP42